MKKVSLFLVGLFLFFVTGLIAQSVTNGDLEDWEAQGNILIVKENPKGWTSRNYVDDNPQAIYCYSTSASYTGQKAAVLQSFSPSPGISLSGFLSLGNFNHEIPNKRGIAFTERPSLMHFAYKYFTNEADPSEFYAAKATVELTMWNSQTEQQIIIGKGEHLITKKTNFYVPTEVAIDYFTDQQPDSMTITFSTPNNPDDPVRLSVDDVYLQFNTITSNDKLYLDQVSIFPNPVKDWLTFFNPADIGDAELLVFDALGQLQLNQMITGTGGQINCQQLHAGLYFYQIRQSDLLLKSGKLMKGND